MTTTTMKRLMSGRCRRPPSPRHQNHLELHRFTNDANRRLLLLAAEFDKLSLWDGFVNFGSHNIAVLSTIPPSNCENVFGHKMLSTHLLTGYHWFVIESLPL